MYLVVLLLFAVGPADWPMLGHDPGRSGATSVEVRPPFARAWYRTFADEGINAGVQPVVAGGRVYLGTLAGVLHAIDATTGAEAWSHRAGGPILHAAAVADGVVVFGSADGKIVGLRAADGAPAWSVTTGRAVWNAPCPFEGVAYVGSRDGRLYAIEVESGRVRWSSPTGGPILGSPAVDAKARRVFVGSEDLRVYAFDVGDGRPAWRSPKLPGVSLRGYHPVVAPDGSVIVTVAPFAGGDALQAVLLDTAREVFGDFASWRHKKDENDRLRAANFALMERPETYRRQMDSLRRRLTDEPSLQTTFVLDPATGRPRFVAPIVYAESMNGPASPPVVARDGRVIVKYSALLRSRYEHYSPFLNVGALDTTTGAIDPIMDQSRTYGWHDSLLLVHDEQSQLSLAGRTLLNTHQDNVNALDLGTLRGDPAPWARNVHEARPGEAAALWATILRGKPLPVGREWLARGTAVYGGGSAIDVPVVVAGDSFYYLPTHELNSGAALIAYRMASAARPAEVAADRLGPDDAATIRALDWDWDILEMPRLDPTLVGLPEARPGTRRRPLRDEARAAVSTIGDDRLDPLILRPAEFVPRPGATAEGRAALARAVEELIGTTWRPLLFPAAKHPPEAYRVFIDPTETLFTLGLAYGQLPDELKERARASVARLRSDGGPLALPTGSRTYPPQTGEVRSAYDPAPNRLFRAADETTRSETARLYPLWLWAHVSGDWVKLRADWPQLKALARSEPPKDEPDLGNGRISGLIAACRIARRFGDDEAGRTFLEQARSALRERLAYELAHTEGGLITRAGSRTGFGRWQGLTPDLALILRTFAGPVHRRLMSVYVDRHRPTWWLAWDLERLWRNEAPLSLPSTSRDVFAARALILGEEAGKLAGFVDIPWCRGDESFIQKLALTLVDVAPGR